MSKEKRAIMKFPCPHCGKEITIGFTKKELREGLRILKTGPRTPPPSKDQMVA